jgi:DNA replication and repair protein RecF
MNEAQMRGSQSPWAVVARVHGAFGEADVGTGAETLMTERRIIRIDEKTAKSQSELAKYVSALWLTPQMDGLFLESDSARRKFLDRLVFAFDAEHAARVQDYEYAMRERNRLLQMPHTDPIWVGTLEKEMAEFGVAMVIARRTVVEHLNESIRATGFSFPKARLALGGFIEDALNAGRPALDVEEEARERLKAARGADAATGRCTFGIHRTVMRSFYDAKNMQAESCSTGEQKALLLSIILGQAMAVKSWKGAAPLLLLDEVVSHLDASRRAELCELLLSLGSQCWLTGTDAVFFEALGDKAQRFTVEGGTITQSN